MIKANPINVMSIANRHIEQRIADGNNRAEFVVFYYLFLLRNLLDKFPVDIDNIIAMLPEHKRNEKIIELKPFMERKRNG